MFGLLSTEILVIVILIISWFCVSKKIEPKQILLACIPFAIFLIILETFRNGAINPDYNLYLQYIYFPNSHRGELEESFFNIVSIARFFNGNHITVFLIYALLGISIKLIAIYKYSYNMIYSICVWIAFSFILHDLIQIRAAVSAGLLLLMIPAVYKKQIYLAIFYWIIAFLFHYSSIIFGVLFILKKNEIKSWIWITGYALIFIINATNYPIFNIVFKIISLLPGTLADRIGKSDPTLLDEMSRMTMYSRYVLIPTIFCFASLYFNKTVKTFYPISTLCIKLCFIGIFLFGIGLPIVSERLYEILQVPMIYIVPTSLLWYHRNAVLKGKIAITVFCLFMSWNLLFKQAVFS